MPEIIPTTSDQPLFTFQIDNFHAIVAFRDAWLKVPRSALPYFRRLPCPAATFRAQDFQSSRMIGFMNRTRFAVGKYEIPDRFFSEGTYSGNPDRKFEAGRYFLPWPQLRVGTITVAGVI